MKAFKGSFRFFVLLVAITFLAACGGSSLSNSGNVDNLIEGLASKGPINGGSVEVYALLEDGNDLSGVGPN